MYHDREIRNYLIPVVINSSLEKSNYAFSPFAIEQSWAILRNSKFKNRWLRYRLPDIDSLAVPSKTSSYQIAGNKCTGCVARVHRHTCVRCCATSCTSFRSTVAEQQYRSVFSAASSVLSSFPVRKWRQASWHELFPTIVVYPSR